MKRPLTAILILIVLTTTIPVQAQDSHVGVTFARDALNVAAEITGVLEAVHVRLGDRVAAGDVLATFRSEPIRRSLERARAALASAEAEVELRQVEHQLAERRIARRSSVNGAVSQEEIEELRSERDAAVLRSEMAAAAAAQRRVEVRGLEDDLRRTEIRAPYAGTISVRYADAGALLSPGQSVVRLLSRDLWIRFALPPEAAQQLQLGSEVSFRCDGSETSHVATLKQIAPDVDPIAGLVFVEADIDELSETGLVVGMVSRVSVD